jgi:hypothetical protein
MFISFPATPSDTPLEIALDAAQRFVHDSIWCITFAIAFTYYMGQEIGRIYFSTVSIPEATLEEPLSGLLKPSEAILSRFRNPLLSSTVTLL